MLFKIVLNFGICPLQIVRGWTHRLGINHPGKYYTKLEAILPIYTHMLYTWLHVRQAKKASEIKECLSLPILYTQIGYSSQNTWIYTIYIFWPPTSLHSSTCTFFTLRCSFTSLLVYILLCHLVYSVLHLRSKFSFAGRRPYDIIFSHNIHFFFFSLYDR